MTVCISPMRAGRPGSGKGFDNCGPLLGRRAVQWLVCAGGSRSNRPPPSVGPLAARRAPSLKRVWGLIEGAHHHQQKRTAALLALCMQLGKVPASQHAMPCHAMPCHRLQSAERPAAGGTSCLRWHQLPKRQARPDHSQQRASCGSPLKYSPAAMPDTLQMTRIGADGGPCGQACQVAEHADARHDPYRTTNLITLHWDQEVQHYCWSDSAQPAQPQRAGFTRATMAQNQSTKLHAACSPSTTICTWQQWMGSTMWSCDCEH
jgi:hypothetical protein